MTPAHTLRLLDQGDMGKTATQQLPCGGQTRYTSTDNAYSVMRLSSTGYTSRLLEQPAVIKTEIGWIGVACSPWLGWG